MRRPYKIVVLSELRIAARSDDVSLSDTSSFLTAASRYAGYGSRSLLVQTKPWPDRFSQPRNPLSRCRKRSAGRAPAKPECQRGSNGLTDASFISLEPKNFDAYDALVELLAGMPSVDPSSQNSSSFTTRLFQESYERLGYPHDYSMIRVVGGHQSPVA